MKIICIGRNYRDHIAEMGDGVAPSEPIFFLKPDTALLRNNDSFYVPSFSKQVEYETELVVRINRVGKSISEKYAHRYYEEVGLGIDFTARDLQAQAIREGLPWEKSKGFDRSAAISPRFLTLSELGCTINELSFEMSLNGQIRQRASVGEMIFSVDTLISYVSQFMTLRMGDLLFTGTPAGVGPVSIGDHLQASLMEWELLNFYIK